MNKLEKLFEHILDMPVTTGRRSMNRVKTLIRLYLDDCYTEDLATYAKELAPKVKKGKK